MPMENETRVTSVPARATRATPMGTVKSSPSGTSNVCP